METRDGGRVTVSARHVRDLARLGRGRRLEAAVGKLERRYGRGYARQALRMAQGAKGGA